MKNQDSEQMHIKFLEDLNKFLSGDKSVNADFIKGEASILFASSKIRKPIIDKLLASYPENKLEAERQFSELLSIYVHPKSSEMSKESKRKILELSEESSERSKTYTKFVTKVEIKAAAKEAKKQYEAEMNRIDMPLSTKPTQIITDLNQPVDPSTNAFFQYDLKSKKNSKGATGVHEKADLSKPQVFDKKKLSEELKKEKAIPLSTNPIEIITDINQPLNPEKHMIFEFNKAKVKRQIEKLKKQHNATIGTPKSPSPTPNDSKGKSNGGLNFYNH